MHLVKLSIKTENTSAKQNKCCYLNYDNMLI